MNVETSNSPVAVKATGEMSPQQGQESKSAAILAFEREMQEVEEQRRREEKEAALAKKQAKKMGKEKAQKHIEGILRELTDEEKRERAAKAEKARREAEELERQEAEARAAWEAQELKRRQEMLKFAAMAAALEAKREAQQQKKSKKEKKSMPKKAPVYSSDEDTSDDESSIHMTAPQKQEKSSGKKKSYLSSSDESSDDESAVYPRRARRNAAEAKIEDDGFGDVPDSPTMKNGDDSITLPPAAAVDHSESCNNESQNNASRTSAFNSSGLKPYAYVGASAVVQIDTDDESDEEKDEKPAEEEEEDMEYEVEYKKEMTDDGEIVWSPVRRPKRSVTANLTSSPPLSSPKVAVTSPIHGSVNTVTQAATSTETSEGPSATMDDDHRNARSPRDDEKMLKFYRPDYDDDCFPKPISPTKSPTKGKTLSMSTRKKTSDLARNYLMNASFNSSQNISWSKPPVQSQNSVGHASKSKLSMSSDDADPLKKYMEADDNYTVPSMTGSSRYFDGNASASRNQDHNASNSRLNGSLSSFAGLNASFSTGLVAEETEKAINMRFPKAAKKTSTTVYPFHISPVAEPKPSVGKEPAWKANRLTNIAAPPVTDDVKKSNAFSSPRTFAKKPSAAGNETAATTGASWTRSSGQGRRASLGAIPSSSGHSCSDGSAFSHNSGGAGGTGFSSIPENVPVKKDGAPAAPTVDRQRRASLGPGSSHGKDTSVQPSWKAKLADKKHLESPAQTTDSSLPSWKKKLLEKKTTDTHEGGATKAPQVEQHTDPSTPSWKKKLLVEKKLENSPLHQEKTKVSDKKVPFDSPKSATLPDEAIPAWKKNLLTKKREEGSFSKLSLS